MRTFMDRDFLLPTDTARRLYHEIAAPLPIIDYHCHLNPREIYEDRRFENITQLWLEGDHYKWRLARAMGVEERFVTGDAPDREKFQRWAETLALAVGNPLYHWSHLELRNFFGYEGLLSGDTAGEVWRLCGEKLAQPGFSARGLIRRSNVEALCTTDDPADSLEWHERLAASDFEVRVLPAFRPDRALGIENVNYVNYIEKLSASSQIQIENYDNLKAALTQRMDFFQAHGCRVSDHGLATVPYAPAGEVALEAIFQKRLAGGKPSPAETAQFQTGLLLFLFREYAARGWAAQLHTGVLRDNSPRLFRLLGPNAGLDSVGARADIPALAAFLGNLDETDQLPKTILYSLDPNDNTALETVMGCFQGAGAGKMQHGAAWWFNDHKEGIQAQLKSLAAQGMLATFVGMLTDSRSFLSYARHEYFRRVLCGLLGDWVEAGEYPADEKALRQIVEGVCYQNAKRYFNL